jgi:hypothetical protein
MLYTYIVCLWIDMLLCMLFCRRFFSGNLLLRVFYTVRGGIREFSDLHCCNCLGERRWEGRPRSYFRKPIATWYRAVNIHCFYTSAFLLRVSICLQWMAKSSNVSASSFAWSSVNQLPKLLNCFVRLLRTFFKQESGFWIAFTFQGRSSVSWRWRTFRATKHQQNDIKCWKNSRTHPPSSNNPWALRHRWNQLMEFARRS